MTEVRHSEQNQSDNRTGTNLHDVPSSNSTTPSPISIQLNEKELKVLRELEAQKSILVKNVDLQVATDLSKQTITLAVASLVNKGLAARPEGNRKGVAITPAGIAFMDQVRKSSVDHP